MDRIRHVPNHFLRLSFKEKLLFFFYLIPLFSLFFYSFTQIDLSLALSRNEGLQEIVKSFQQIGYFNRPLSTTLFIAIALTLFIFYITFLRMACKKKISKTFAWLLIGTATIVLTFSYNAFSYDIFNYIFDAKIITEYGQNPYMQKALDYPQDPMLSFMRWTHRVYPYGPVWLALTVPLSFIGLQIFLITFLLFKLFIVASFVGCVYFIGKILQKVAPEREVLGILFFGLNPLILVESVVSAHIDIVMMCAALWAIYFFVKEKYIPSYGMLFASIGIKFVTAALLPVFLVVQRMKSQHIKIRWNYVFGACLMLLIGGVIAQSLRSNFQPWYLIDTLAFAALISHRYYIIIPSVTISFFALLNYVPFLQSGNWNPPIPQQLSDMNFLSYSLSFLIVGIYFFFMQVQFARRVKNNKK
ncbi:MAG: DUF2029 domain-containing protein [Candidatus Levybacteria bacterium]|nr:DUF2029 domain-containing protein [Candidatus Levybacteria bacterium]